MASQSDPGLPLFDRQPLDSSRPFSRIGDGALGGKAEGLLQLRMQILPGLRPEEFPGFQVDVPPLTVLTTEVFENFMESNGLRELAMDATSNARIAEAFQEAEMPAQYADDLRALVARPLIPLVVRSSNLLESTRDYPFAGVYSTKLIPNSQEEESDRYDSLVAAVKFVFASTFFRAAKDYVRRIGSAPELERMAVIVQEAVGQAHGDRFYPCVSGVARTYNHYPWGTTSAEDGVANLALGLGKTVIDGGRTWMYCPADPRRPAPFRSVRGLLKSCQARFWAIDTGEPRVSQPTRETEFLARCGLDEAEADGALRHVASTYSAESDALTPGTGNRGPRVLNFAPLLTLKEIPFNDVLVRLLDRSREALGSHAEMEFAVNLDPERGLPARVACLQVRPMPVSEERIDVQESDLEGDDVLLASRSVLGHGSPADIRDVVFVRPGGFDPVFNRLIAAEVERFDKTLRAAERPYVLIGFGRWGTTDPWVGIPVSWSQICGACVVVEATLPQMNPEPSQGSNFFENLIAFRVLHLSVKHDDEHPIDWDWLDEQETVTEGDFVKHVRTAQPLKILVDGHTGRGVVKRVSG